MADWRDELGALFSRAGEQQEHEPESEIGRFMAAVVLPAFADVARELERHGRQVTVRPAATSASLLVAHAGEEELTYRVQGRMFPGGILPYAEVRYRERKGLRLLRTESMFRSGAADYKLADVTSADVIRNFLDHYKRLVLAD